MTPIPIPIPRDLKPGDLLICSDGVTRIFAVWDESAERDFPVGTRYGHWFTRKGVSCLGDPVVIRIERIASKARKAKVDKDAAWLLRLACAMNTQGARSECKRLRAIARRLGGGGK